MHARARQGRERLHADRIEAERDPRVRGDESERRRDVGGEEGFVARVRGGQRSGLDLDHEVVGVRAREPRSAEVGRRVESS